MTFIPPEDNTAPAQSDGGLSRSGISFTPPRDNPSPQRTAGGASRIGFTLPRDNPIPRRTTGGGSRLGFIPPPNNPTPRQTANGGSREGEIEDIALLFSNEGFDDRALYENTTAMTALVPSNLYGLTISARPSIMAYLPKTRAHTAIFSLKDENQSVVYRQLLSLAETDGILKVSLPADAPALAVGEYYQWFITLQTDEYINPGSPYVTAWIKRVDVSSVMAQTILSSQDGLAKAAVFAQAGIWYDAAEQLADLQIDSQTQANTTADWTEFLTSVGLNVLSEYSFLNN
ncbi:MAG: DUF928 domain-containing protein [Leptolyngbyaceae cyanobacterium MAG.088]|nr:DUF928 domain-containing protein [Leptolyngbyaceae cyanobacterium MAG.088]